MKPLSLEIQAFGPFVEKQYVDFEKLSRNGMFLVKGDTGSGKTTIFDAMTFALYGGSSGNDEKSKIGRNDLEEWRCNQAPDELDTYVSFTFSSRGRTYLFKRGLAKKRKNLSPFYEAGEILGDGTEMPFFENPKKESLNQKAEEIVGLSKEQFRQVILLPQGQFERFLLADSKDKEEILTKIFGTERWAKYADRYFAAASERKKEFDEKNNKINIALHEESVQSLDGLMELINSLKSEQSKAQEAHKSFDGGKKQKGLDEDRTLAEQFKQLHELEQEKENLDAEVEEIEKKNTEYTEATRAEELRSAITDVENAKKNLTKRENALSSAEKNIPIAEKAAEGAKTAFDECEKESPIAQNTKRIGELEGKREVYSNFDELKAAEKSSEEEFNKAKAAFDEAKGKYDNANEDAITKKAKFDSAADEEKQYRDRYYAGIYGIIASELKEGDPCPVCGSVNHPVPASKAPDSVEKKELESKEKAAQKARKDWDAAEEKRGEAEKDKHSAEDVLKEKEGKYRKCVASREEAEKQLVDGIADLVGLEKSIIALKTANEEYSEKQKELADSLDLAKKTLAQAKEKKENLTEERNQAQEEYNTLSASLEKTLAEKGFDDIATVKSLLRSSEVREQLHSDVVEHKRATEDNKKNLEKKQKELKGKSEPDKSKFEERQNKINEEAKNYSETIARLDEKIKRLSPKHERLSKEKLEYDNGIKQVEDDWGFAKKLRGDTGVGLSRYVLAVMFGQVIAEANRMLEKVHGGRYRLLRTSDRGAGNKRGLELKVHDNRSPDKEGRSVAMLSGGEKFLVSLALSIGMSTIAQTAGVQIEALFIDEGFGTLDEKSIGDAMDVLDSVRRSSGTIGIISHVSVLEENIATQVEVIKKNEGSHIRLL